METESDITVRHNADGRRYELLDGDAVIGEAHYLPFDGADEPQRIFYHTTVDDAYSGQGLASKLARGALDGTIANGKTIVPVCPLHQVLARQARRLPTPRDTRPPGAPAGVVGDESVIMHGASH